MTTKGNHHDRRAVLKAAMFSGGAAVAGFFAGPLAQAAPTVKEQDGHAKFEQATRGMPAPLIRDVSVIETGGGGNNDSTVVKVTTDQPGLYGYGCATTTFPGGRSKLVKAAVEQYLKPLVMGRTTDRIEQIWQLCYMSSYYKNDNVQNCAISGVCDALWDIKGRQAGMPVYQLVGGKVRDAADIYLHVFLAPQDTNEKLIESSMKLVEGGCRNLLIAMFVRDGATNNAYGQPKFDDGSIPFDRDKEIAKVLSACETFRKQMPPEIGLGIDVHSLLDSIRATEFCKDVEPFHLFYCEDLFPPEESGHYKIVRQMCTTPLAIGELWNNPHEWQPLVQDRLIDYVRHHVSHIGGFTAAQKIAAFADNYEVKFAWHGAPNSPVGHMTNLTLGLTNNNFGIHEHFDYTPLVQDIFQGHLEVKNGYAWISEKPGWGIEVDEALAAKHPITDERPNEMRAPDGSVINGTG
ncbi:MAG TPA: enolase C-terminal domain-like protein [Candidatus Baltobacteraceae bacterium]|nr:enolase C-terminal domain-like protein [Candidatus Baltobacteraceae bacterium]